MEQPVRRGARSGEQEEEEHHGEPRPSAAAALQGESSQFANELRLGVKVGMPISKMYFCMGCISGPSASMRSSTLWLMGSGVMTRFCADALLETDLRMIPDIFPPSPSGMFTRVLGEHPRRRRAAMGEPTDANSAPCAFGCCLAVTAAAKDAVGAFFPESGASTAVDASSPRHTSGLYAEF